MAQGIFIGIEKYLSYVFDMLIINRNPKKINSIFNKS